MNQFDHARRYLDTISGAVSGNGGHNDTFRVAMVLVQDFALSTSEAKTLLIEYNQRCSPPWSEKEIDHKLADAEKNIDPSKLGCKVTKPKGVKYRSSAVPPHQAPTPTRASRPVEVKKLRYEVSDSIELPEIIPDSTLKFLESVFQSGDGISISKGRFNEDKKEIPSDSGFVDSRDNWIARLCKANGNINKIYKTTERNGIFVRINSVRDGRGTDSDVLSFRHALLEFDKIPIRQQWSLITQSGIPCTAVILSGGKSIHCWIPVNASSHEEYTQSVLKIYEHFAPWKPDPNNKNPSRFSRLPGCERGNNRQELLALNLHFEKTFNEWMDSIPSEAELKLLEREFNDSKPPPEDAPVYHLAGVPVCTVGNLTSIVAQAKTGKSAVVGAMLASTFAAGGADLLGFESSNRDGKAVVHFDTEQSIYDWYSGVKRAESRSGSKKPAWMMSFCLTGYLPKEAWDAVCTGVKIARKRFSGIHSIIIDGVGDLVRDVNDAGECTDFVSQLHDLAITNNCPLIGVLHFNPESAKARGHLGSQLERKSESNLRLDKEDDGATILWSNKQRRSAISRDDGPRFTWNTERGMHVTIECSAEAKVNAKAEQAKPMRDEVFGTRLAMKWTEMVEGIEKAEKVAHRTAERRAGKWKELGIVEHGLAGNWVKKDSA